MKLVKEKSCPESPNHKSAAFCKKEKVNSSSKRLAGVDERELIESICSLQAVGRGLGNRRHGSANENDPGDVRLPGSE